MEIPAFSKTLAVVNLSDDPTTIVQGNGKFRYLIGSEKLEDQEIKDEMFSPPWVSLSLKAKPSLKESKAEIDKLEASIIRLFFPFHPTVFVTPQGWTLENDEYHALVCVVAKVR